ncbi:MAG TPA: hypothetical protein PLB96_13505 [Syntrophales bacterium]|nr:hypothetical protein [Syntrophales bacterium]
MPDYWIKISETEEEDVRHHHYLISAEDETQVRKSAMKFMESFIDDDENPDKIENGFAFFNKAVMVRLESIKETTKEKFKEFLLKTHTIDMTEPKTKPSR